MRARKTRETNPLFRRDGMESSHNWPRTKKIRRHEARAKSLNRRTKQRQKLFLYICLSSLFFLSHNLQDSASKGFIVSAEAFAFQPLLSRERKGTIFAPKASSLPNGTRNVRTTKACLLPQEFVTGTISVTTVVTGAYGEMLLEHTLPTKSLTAGALCGIGDIIAQNRDPSNDEYNLQRTMRFASKGCFGGILWSFWYDGIDGFLRLEDEDAMNPGISSPSLSLYTLTGGLLPAQINEFFLAFCKDHVGVVTTVMSILMEQFLWCPIVYGTFEIPVSTLLNGGSPMNIRGEIQEKLKDLLVSNAKVWTLANLIIYNAPLEWRLFLGNVIDIFWQSIVSDVSADCGGSQEECIISPTSAKQR